MARLAGHVLLDRLRVGGPVNMVESLRKGQARSRLSKFLVD